MEETVLVEEQSLQKNELSQESKKKRGRKNVSEENDVKPRKKRIPKSENSKVSLMKRYEECRRELEKLNEQKQKIEETIKNLTQEIEDVKNELLSYLSL